MDPSKPETFMHLARSITPIFGQGSPCQVFCAQSKRAQVSKIVTEDKLNIITVTLQLPETILCI